ncbi:NAD(P)/FAD-dependent oxidoreductase [Saccharopolyspora rhizosphaerae]|uniref:NAD(P)/FAD-dependent oxidoreductase n=1 Tax=Saccharopolyspora rhizosphaerae TaxID=2492662 RepID=A0A426K5M2_9PSEU|nr:NAD(P)-binding domain-containing protein [Saccharopolyspora rhizosphaerae]RRO20707.1 NAD(P)/FAD-dependent oxidoreductase [Saccharopolyspora rhizosphaerae]
MQFGVDASAPGGDRTATVVVLGGGQAGLSAGYHLQRKGFVSALEDTGARSFVVLDANQAPGGAWRHRWESLRMATVNGIFDLPGFAQPPVDPDEPSRVAVPRYFSAFERATQLPVLRPVQVTAVRPAVPDEPDGDLLVETDRGRWTTRAVINATGTWTNPVLPHYPGQETFRGRQLHTQDYVAAERFAGLRVAVVGGGISAVQQLAEISEVATTFWYTRREPVFREGAFDRDAGREVVAEVAADVEAGRPAGSIVSYTGLAWTSYAVAAAQRGALQRRPLFTRIEPRGLREADGTFTPVDVILWATGFRPALAHLDPLGLRTELGGVRVRGTQVVGDPRVHLVGFGPSQSTVGANRAGREAAHALVRHLRRRDPTVTPAG